MFQLQDTRTAPMIRVHAADPTVFALANMGAGRLLWLAFTKFPTEQPTVVRFCLKKDDDGATLLDGGDVHLMFVDDFRSTLDGSVNLAPRRRRAEEADAERRNREAEDDD